DSRASAIHAQIVGLARPIPDLPNQFRQAVARDRAINAEYGRGGALLTVAVFAAFGFGAEWLFRKMTGRVRRRFDELSIETANDRLRLIAVRLAFGVGMIAAFAFGSVGL